MKNLKNWDDKYWNQIKANIGLFTIEDQEKIRKTPIAIFGLGGIGGPLVEQLARVGCEEIIVCDNDVFEESNINRQLCTRKDLGRYKVDFVRDLVKDINPNINIRFYYKVNEGNISELLKDISIISLALDDPFTSILIARRCRKLKIPMVESFGLPYLFSMWFTTDSMDYESFYDLETKEMSVKEMKKSKNLQNTMKKKLYSKFLAFPGLKQTYNRKKGTLDTFFQDRPYSISIAPIVRMTASYLAFEILYSGILKIKKMILVPKILGFDYIRMKMIRFEL